LVPVKNPYFADTAGIYAHPSPENKRQAGEVLAAVFGGGSAEEHIAGKEQPSNIELINLS
jgi:hypothetical protein